LHSSTAGRGGIARDLAGPQKQQRPRRPAARHGLRQERGVIFSATRFLSGRAAEREYVHHWTFGADAEGGGDLTIGHLEIRADEAEEMEELRGRRRAFAIGLGGTPVRNCFVVQSAQLLRGDEGIDLGNDEKATASE